MRVNNVNVVLVNKVCDGSRRLKVERVPERHLVPRRDDARKRAAQGAVGSHGKVYGVASTGKPAHEVCDVDFAAAHLACRANL